MAKKTLTYPALRIKFDWDKLEQRMTAAGGIAHCLKQADIPLAGWYNMRQSDENIPVRMPIQKLAAHFNMTAEDLRELFIIKPVRERKK